MSTEDLIWDAPPLSAEDQRLIDAYMQVGRPLDTLAYTVDFDRLYAAATAGSGGGTVPTKHDIYTRLLTLRKMARLPRLVRAS